jgi:hypothetical protein
MTLENPSAIKEFTRIEDLLTELQKQIEEVVIRAYDEGYCDGQTEAENQDEPDKEIN